MFLKISGCLMRVFVHAKEGCIIGKCRSMDFSAKSLSQVYSKNKTGPNYGNKYARTLICDLSKYLVTIAVPEKSANTVARAIFEYCVLVYGKINSVKSDLGTEFKNEIFLIIFEGIMPICLGLIMY